MIYDADNMPTGKVFITNKHVNRISYRSLNRFELRNARLTLTFNSLHDTWLDAHAEILRQRESDVKRAAADLVKARAALKRARAMQPKEKKA